MESPRVAGRIRGARACAALCGAAILLATLLPLPALVPGLGRQLDLADLLRNLLLFAPLGVALCAAGWSPGPVVAAGLALSGAVELAQVVIPGRQPGPTDWLANGAGTAIGAGLWRLGEGGRALLPWWLVGAASLLLLLATGPLLAPAPTALRSFAHLDPELAHLETYTGSIGEARLAGLQLDHGPIAPGEPLRRALAGDFRLELHGQAGAPPRGQAAFLLITDALQRELLLVGPAGADLVLRYRSRASALGLGLARLRMPDALASLVTGEPFVLQLSRRGAELCLTVDGAQTCGHGFDPGDGWALLAPVSRGLERHQAAIGGLWIALLALPAGVLAGPRRRPLAGAAVGVLLLLALAGSAASLRAPGPGLLLAALLGLWGGAALRWAGIAGGSAPLRRGGGHA